MLDDATREALHTTQQMIARLVQDIVRKERETGARFSHITKRADGTYAAILKIPTEDERVNDAWASSLPSGE